MKCIISSLIQRKDDESIALQDEKMSISYSKMLILLEINSRRIVNNNEQNIGVIAENSIEFVVAFLSIIYAGKTAIIITNSNKGKELINTCDIKTIFVGTTKKIQFKKAIAVLHTIIECTVQIEQYKHDYHYDDNYIAVVMSTSGTTGESDVVPILYRNLNKRIWCTNMHYPRTAGHKELIIVPIYLTLGNQQQLLTALYVGMHIYIYSGVYFPRKIVSIINSEKIDYVSFVPTMLDAFVNCLEQEKISVKLKGIYIAGDTLRSELVRKTKDVLNCTSIYSAYGMTEIAPICIKKYNNQNKDESLSGVGKPIKGMQIKIVQGSENWKIGNAIGEICVKHSMIEVERYSEDGWFHTGDIGYVDDDGEVVLCGRLKNMLIRNGYNIFPEIIERKISNSGMVKEVMVFINNSKLTANIVVEQETFEKTDLINYCKLNLEPEEIPCDFKIVGVIEKNENMKIMRKNSRLKEDKEYDKVDN